MLLFAAARLPRLRRRARHRPGVLPRHRAHPAALPGHPGGARHRRHHRAGQRLPGAAHASDILVLLSVVAVAAALSALPPGPARAAGESGGLRRLHRLPGRDADAASGPFCPAPGRPRSSFRCSACATAARSSTTRCSPPPPRWRAWPARRWSSGSSCAAGRKAQEGAQARFTQRALWERALGAADAPSSRCRRASSSSRR